jgi:hypothetical protein
MRSVVAPVLTLAVCLAVSVRAEEPRKEAELRALPKVTARSVILKDIDAKDAEKESTRTRVFVQELIAEKEKKANLELVTLLKKIKDDEDAKAAAEKERRRREQNYEGSWGALVGRSSSKNQRGNLRVKLDFQVLEIDTYRQAAEVSKRMETLANEIVDTLPKLDRDGDGKLTVEEYREAGAILSATSKLFQGLDGHADGSISESDIENARTIPASASAASKAGRAAAEATGFKIKTYDADSDGILDVTERKALTMAYVDAALRWGQEAGFYTRLADNLAVARQVVAAKFASIDVGQ